VLREVKVGPPTAEESRRHVTQSDQTMLHRLGELRLRRTRYGHGGWQLLPSTTWRWRRSTSVLDDITIGLAV